MINFRILGLVFFFLTIAYFGVVAVRTSNSLEVWVEYIPPHGVLASAPVKLGFSLAVNESKVTLSIPNCAVDNFPEKFFLHVYPASQAAQKSDEFINMDFDLVQEKGEKVIMNGKSICQYEKNFGYLDVQEVVIGQYELLAGKCCKVLWSRHFKPFSKRGG